MRRTTAIALITLVVVTGSVWLFLRVNYRASAKNVDLDSVEYEAGDSIALLYDLGTAKVPDNMQAISVTPAAPAPDWLLLPDPESDIDFDQNVMLSGNGIDRPKTDVAQLVIYSDQDAWNSQRESVRENPERKPLATDLHIAGLPQDSIETYSLDITGSPSSDDHRTIVNIFVERPDYPLAMLLIADYGDASPLPEDWIEERLSHFDFSGK